jgi:hypothetical protein
VVDSCEHGNEPMASIESEASGPCSEVDPTYEH